jgi:hypothetical protein
MPNLFGPGVPGQIAVRNQSLQILDFIEQCINDGNRYMVGGYATIASGGTVDITIQTPDTTKWIHILYRGELSSAATVDFYENVTDISGGIPLAMVNKNRNSDNASSAVVLFNPSVTPGDKIDGFKYGSAGGNPTRIRKMILKQNTAYLWRIVSQAADNSFSFHGEWDEFTVVNGT